LNIFFICYVNLFKKRNQNRIPDAEVLYQN